jgi:hypothetical protein
MIKAHETIDDLFYNMKHQIENVHLLNNVQKVIFFYGFLIMYEKKPDEKKKEILLENVTFIEEYLIIGSK